MSLSYVVQESLNSRERAPVGALRHITTMTTQNPPYGPKAEPFLAKLAEHGDGVALLFARTETAMFHKYVWSEADALLFLKGRLYFHRPDGTRAPGNAAGPSALIAYGNENASALKDSGLDGAFVPLTNSNHSHSDPDENGFH